MCFREFFHDAVIRDGEDTDVEGLLRFTDETPDTVEAVIARAEVRAALDLIFSGVEELDDALEPVHGADLADFFHLSRGDAEGELPSLGLLSGVVGDGREVSLEFFTLSAAEREVFERLGEEGFEIVHESGNYRRRVPKEGLRLWCLKIVTRGPLSVISKIK